MTLIKTKTLRVGIAVYQTNLRKNQLPERQARREYWTCNT